MEKFERLGRRPKFASAQQRARWCADEINRWWARNWGVNAGADINGKNHVQSNIMLTGIRLKGVKK